MTQAAIKSSISAIASRTAAGGTPLGSLVWWKLAGRHAHSQIVTAFEKYGLDSKMVPSALDTTRAFRRAVRRTLKGKGGANLVRPMADDTAVVLGVVEEHKNEAARELSYTTTDTISLDKATGEITGGKAAGVEAETKALESMVEGVDLTRMLVRWIESVGGAALRDDGGVYWVPAAADAQLRSMQAAIEESCAGCAIYPLPVAASASGEAERALGDSAKAGLEVQLADVAEEIEEFKKEPPRKVTLERRLVRFEELRNRASMYKSLLQVSAGDLEAKISEMESTVKALISAIPEAPEGEKKTVTRAQKFEDGAKVQVKLDEAPQYLRAGVTSDTILTVTGAGPSRGTLWCQLPDSEVALILPKSHLVEIDA